MADVHLHKTYVSELHGALGYFGTWLPSVWLELGDIMTWTPRGLERVGHVRDHSLSFTARATGGGHHYEYASSGAVSITAKAAGETLEGSTLAHGEAGLVVRFSRENAVLLDAVDCANSTIANIGPLGRAIEKAYAAKVWDREWMVITEVVEAKAATIIVSSGKAGHADIKIGGTVKQGGTKLADANMTFEAKHTSNIGLKIISSAGLRPLYRASGIKTSWIGTSPRFRSRDRNSSAHERNGYSFSKLAPNDF